MGATAGTRHASASEVPELRSAHRGPFNPRFGRTTVTRVNSTITAARQLAGRLRGWWQALFGRDPLTAGLEVFLDAELLARDCQAQDQGWEAGRTNQPPAEEDRYDDFHLRLLGRCENAVLELKRRAIRLLHSNEQSQLAHDPRPADADLVRVERDIVLAIDQHFVDARKSLVALQAKVLLQQRELNFFIARNRLQRLARYKPWWLWSGALVLLIIGESLVNASMFAKASDYGLLGGWTQAIAVAALNVVFSFLVGKVVLRNLLHIHPLRRALAAFGLIGFLMVIALFHLGVGHYRELLDVDPAHAAQQAVKALWERGVFLHNLEAWSLVLVGLIGAAISLIDGFVWSGDPYPGYGRVDRYVRHAQEEFDAALKRLWVGVEQSLRRGDRELAAPVRRMEGLLAAMVAQVRAFDAIRRRYRERAWQIESACIRTLEIFRNAARQVRTAPAPAYFDTVPELDTALDYDLDPAEDRCTQLAEWVDAAKDQAQDIRQRLQDKKQQRFEGLAEYLADIEGAAKQQAGITGRLFENSNVVNEDVQPPPQSA